MAEMVPGADDARRMLRAPCATVRVCHSGRTTPSSGSGRRRAISIFGSLVTRIALPFVAILVLGAGADRGRAPARHRLLAAVLVVGLVAGAWVDRLRRRPVLIWADLGRAVLLGSIPIAFALGGC